MDNGMFARMSGKAYTRLAQSVLLALAVVGVGTAVQADVTSAPVFTVQLQTSPSVVVPLVSHGEPWHYRKGASSPPSDWRRLPDAELDASWSVGPGGFGYADDDDATVLTDMRNRYSSLYIRKSFEMPAGIDPDRRLHLLMDWDDGFVAYLDGIEVARALVAGPPGSEPDFRATAMGSHEASKGDNFANPPRTFDLGPVGGRLQPGTQILSIHGLNQAIDSSDFSLIADLLIDGADTQVIDGSLVSIVKTNLVTLFGTNTFPNTAQVRVGGSQVTVDPALGGWTTQYALTGAVNRIAIEAFDAFGKRLAVTNRTIILDRGTTRVGGILESNSVWSPSMGIIRVTNHAVVNGSLAIAPGTIVLVGAGFSIRATNATVTIEGTSREPVLLAPADGTSPWGAIGVNGPQGQLSVRHAEVIAGGIEVRDGASGLLEDSYLHDYLVGSTPIIHVVSASSFTERRCHVARYYEHLIALTAALIEDCLCEHIFGDGIDFDGAPPGAIIRRCTVRHGGGTNIDGIDLGSYPGVSTSGVLIEQCLIYDFPFDKGISIGESAIDIVVRNCVIYDVDSGVAIKDSSKATILNNTIVNANVGLNLYEKNFRQGGGHALALNNVLWNNKSSVAATNESTIALSFNLLSSLEAFGGTNNISADPLFRSPTQRDYRLSSNSPGLGAGLGATNMGVLLPAGTSLVDLDRDQMPDVWELWSGFDANNPEDGLLDPDNDGLTNSQEFAAGTDPFSAGSGLKITSLAHRGDFAFEFTAAPDKSYSILVRDSFQSGGWNEMQKIAESPNARTIEVKDPSAPAAQVRFYRVVTPALR